ncbi:hypothetical protein J2T09_001968 [Neorhizobium huautlense]|uniref:Uncharacterized protein n=1 Tax=Neorhizobium huautlense TaxID=67774 RepID=A0ABT9PSN2_9HYPH|nr:hypothetical protein [Neorhizobium huautlense]MDP9837216.1 hypothetical protein [Neorhizobium huautlense]
MNNPILPTLDGLLGLAQTFSENASQKNWAEIEDLEKEHGASDGNVRQMLSNGTSLSTLAGPADLLQRASAAWDGKADASGMSRAEILVEESAEFSSPATALQEAETGAELHSGSSEISPSPLSGNSGKPVSGPQPSMMQSADWNGVSEVALAPVSADAGKERVIEAAIAGVEHALATSGPAASAQKLHAATRSLSAEQVSVLLDNAAPLITRLVEQAAHSENAVGVTDEKPRDAKAALVLAHVAAAIDKDPRPPSSIRLLRDIGTILLAPANQNDNAVFSGLVRTIAVGAGVRLVLAVADELAHRDGNPSRAKALVTLMLSAFADLGARIEAAYSDVLQQVGPLCLEWLAWRDEGEERAIARLIEHLQRQPAALEDMAPKLERLEQVGLETFRAVRDLAAFALDPRLETVRGHFLNSPEIFGAISGSRMAIRDMRHAMTVPSAGNRDETLDMVRLTLTDIGFSAPRAAFLAELCELENNALMLGAGWTALESFQFMEQQGRAFQRLLSFLNGQFVMAAAPDVIGFGDDDMQV